jgi:hypothetical protein
VAFGLALLAGKDLADDSGNRRYAEAKADRSGEEIDDYGMCLKYFDLPKLQVET